MKKTNMNRCLCLLISCWFCQMIGCWTSTWHSIIIWCRSGSNLWIFCWSGHYGTVFLIIQVYLRFKQMKTKKELSIFLTSNINPPILTTLHNLSIINLIHTTPPIKILMPIRKPPRITPTTSHLSPPRPRNNFTSVMVKTVFVGITLSVWQN